eukprot:Pgem_evm1s17709
MSLKAVQKCASCELRVLEVEKVTIKNSILHKECLYCYTCDLSLSETNCQQIRNKLFCIPHYRKECQRL